MVSQPGVSRALARLEKEVGLPAPAAQRPDAAGHARGHGVQAARRRRPPLLRRRPRGRRASSSTRRPARSRSPSSCPWATWLVPDLVDTFRRDHPRVRFRLHSSDDARGSMVLADSHLDLELTARRPTEEGVSWEHLFTQPLVLAVSLDHPLAERTEVRLDEVADDDFVMLRPVLGAARADRQACAARPASRLARPSSPTTWPSSAASSPPGSEWRRPGRRLRSRARPTGANGTCGSRTWARTARSAWPGRRNAGCCPRPSCSVAT